MVRKQKLIVFFIALILVATPLLGFASDSPIRVNKLVDAEYDYLYNVYTDGLAVAYRQEDVINAYGQRSTHYYYGYADTSGNLVIPQIYDAMRDFDGGLSAVKKDGKWGLIDRTGKVIIPLQYDDVGTFSEGLLSVCKNGKWGVINKSSKTIIPFEYDIIYNFKNGLAFAMKNGSTGCIDKTGKVIIPFEYGSVLGSDLCFNENIAILQTDYGMNFINTSGKVIAKTPYNSTQGFNEGLAAVGNTYDLGNLGNGKYGIGYMNTAGKIVIPIQYEVSSKNFYGGLACVSKNDKFGYIDKTGKTVIPFNYDDARSFIGDFAAVSKNEKWGFINKSGKVVIPLEYEYVGDFKEGRVAVQKNGKMGFLDSAGKVIVPLIHDGVNDFHNGFAILEKNRGGGYLSKDGAIVDKNGKIIIPFEDGYFNIENFNEGFAIGVASDDTPVIFSIDKFSAGANTAKPITATPTSSKILLNGKAVSFDAYNIEGSNYFKIRDLAFALKDTNAKFEVSWDGAKNAINLNNDKDYTVQGTEMVQGTTGNKTVTRSDSKVYLDGKEISLSCYIINGSSYFKLVDVGAALGFDVVWNESDKSVLIDTQEKTEF